MRNHSLFIDSLLLGLCIGLLHIGSVGCNDLQREHLKETGWTTLDCSLYSSIGCAGQAAGACEPPSLSSGDSWGNYAECISVSSQSCIAKSLGRCALAGIASLVSGPIVSGGSGCGQEEHREEALRCLAGAEIKSQREAIESSAKCWREVCGY